jgi:A/G-specific adenine glycosylase
VSDFAKSLIAWQRVHGRHDLPWQQTRDPYRVWLSEVMLQQTQVEAVIPYYRRFLGRFPDVLALARASEEEVLRLWSGLGYYARARNLHRAARQVARDHAGRFPDTVDALAALPGVGRSTAAAIGAFAFGRRAAILDGNVKRVLSRAFGIEGFPGERTVEARLWRLAEEQLPGRGIERYTQALMDLGATLCTRARPRCGDCPLVGRCVARSAGRVAELPAARPRRPYPRKQVTWLVLLDAGRVLLERRPAPGLWGGLWTFPEMRTGSPAAFCRKQLGCEVRLLARLEPLEHGFTHFRLCARPVLYGVKQTSLRAEQPGMLWLDLTEARHAATPAPVKKLLTRLASRPA